MSYQHSPFVTLLIRCHLSVSSYCMPNRNDDEVPNSWLCGNCTLDGAKSPDGSGLQVQPKMPRHAKIGKVKFLPTEEVMKLSSGGINAPSKLNTTFAPQKKSNFRKVFESSMPRPLFQASKESQGRFFSMFLSFLAFVTVGVNLWTVYHKIWIQDDIISF